VQQNNFSVTILAILNGNQTLYNQTFAQPFGDAGVQQAVSTAQSILQGAGGTNLSGPTLASSNTAMQSSVQSTTETSRSAVIGAVAVSTTVGPATIDRLQFPGDAAIGTGGLNLGTTLGTGDAFNPALLALLSSTPLFGAFGDQLAGGQVDVNVNTELDLTIFRNIVTTNSFLTSETYIISATTNGAVGPGGGGGAPVPLPTAAWQGLIGMALVAMLHLKFRRTAVAQRA
jgi:hypothetical protein